MLPRLALILAFAVGLAPAAVDAQTPSSPQQFDAPAYVAVAEGGVTLERDGRVDTAPLNMPLLSGDRVKTADGRAEIRFADGGTLALDARTTIDIMSDELTRLLAGRVRLVLPRATRDVRYRLDSSAGSVRIERAGEYRVALLENSQETQLEFAVVRGGGEIFTDQGTTTVRAGERAYASAGLLPSYAYAYNSASGDSFDRWSDAERDAAYAGSGASAQYLPGDMRAYAPAFDEYGDWRYQAQYGYVWYPRVAADWRPYYYGRWASYPGYGWTWIAGDRFGWPTHHYGRWGYATGLWFWIPSSRWAPAYVSWGYAPEYVSWCPLGWDDRAVISINIFNGAGYYAAGPRYYSAWTIVPRGAFGRGNAYDRAVAWDRLDVRGRTRFEPRPSAPAVDYAVPRGSAPIRYAGVREAPRFVGRGDEIVRSPSGRSGPSAQTPPDGASRRSPSSPQSSPDSAGRAYQPSLRAAPRSGVAASSDRARPRQPAYAPPPSAGVERSPAAPGGRPFERATPRPQLPYEPSSGGGRVEAPRPVERAAPRETAVPRGAGAPARNESRGGSAPAPRGGGRDR